MSVFNRLTRTKKKIATLGASAFLVAIFFVPVVASAHEVYVLSPAEITKALGIASFNEFAVIRDNLPEFLLWTCISIATVLLVFWISVLRSSRRLLARLYARIRPWAAPISRVTVGLSFLAGAYYQASYGPELPLSNTYGHFTGYATIVLITIGTLITFNLFTRTAAFVAFCMYGIAVWFHGVYMLTYINYLGEILVLILIGSHHGVPTAGMVDETGTASAVHFKKIRDLAKTLATKLTPYAFTAIRIFFGIALIYTSLYAKVLHNNLALFTVQLYHLDTILGFEQHFLVVGAAIIEIVMGVFFIIGFEIRFTSLFFEFWLIQSLIFFKEAVWPHVILIGLPIALICYGYDKYSLGYWLTKKLDQRGKNLSAEAGRVDLADERRFEPVL